MREVKFVKDFATKKKGESESYDNSLANTLVKKGVAEYVDKEAQAALEKAAKNENDKLEARKKAEAKAAKEIAAEETKRVAANAKALEDQEKANAALVKKFSKK